MSKVLVKVARTFAPHALLLNAACRALESAKVKGEGFWWDWLAATLYSSLSIEAIGNTYGETFIPRWQDFETASPQAKIRLVAEHCGIQPDFSSCPWSIVPELVRFRNRIAHAKLEDICVEAVYPEEDYQKHLYAKPESKLEKMITERFAQQGYDCIREILQLLGSRLPVEKIVEIEVDSWHGGASPAPETEPSL